MSANILPPAVLDLRTEDAETDGYISPTVPFEEIEARLLDPEKDKAVIAKLQEDERGPVALFSDPCWVERPGAASDRDPRCTSTPPPGSVVAKRPAREHKKTGKLRAAK